MLEILLQPSVFACVADVVIIVVNPLYNSLFLYCCAAIAVHYSLFYVNVIVGVVVIFIFVVIVSISIVLFLFLVRAVIAVDITVETIFIL
mmetsp:Transcript_31855/g.36562  ORF Transcript_31855/g.36562 Transcript_31855/m.36562 type:complete len:90 (+) Transcript_31855:2-271(+)